MRLKQRGTFIGLMAVTLMVVAGIAGPSLLKPRPETSPEVMGMAFEPYEAQKAVYHLMDSEWFHERRFRNMLHVAHNHMNAVAFNEVDLRVMLQGGGVDLLAKARTDARLSGSIDALRKAGVRFMVCRNTLVLRGIDPARELYRVSPQDIVSSSMAETARLVGQGYVYFRF